MKNVGELLVVDDDKVFLAIHKNLLKTLTGIEPLTFLNGEEILHYLDEFEMPKKENLLFLDINMPTMDGWEFLDHLQTREYAKNISVVIITSSILHEDYEKAKTYSQVLDYCTKPFSRKDVLNVMEKYYSAISV